MFPLSAYLWKAAKLWQCKYFRIENGRGEPTLITLTKLADALEVTLDYLIEGGELLDKDVLARTKEIQQLPEGDRKHIFYTLGNLIKAAKFKAIQ